MTNSPTNLQALEEQLQASVYLMQQILVRLKDMESKRSNTAPYDVRATAKYLGCSESMVKKLLASGKLKGFRVGDLWRVSPADLDSFIAKGGTAND